MTLHRPAALLGLAIGDALGMPFEKPRGQVHKDLATWDGSFKPGTWHKLPAGHYTDDTEMALCLAESLLEQKNHVAADVAKRYLAWANATPHGMGSTTRAAMDALRAGKSHEESGVMFADAEWAQVGSGTAMRVAPLGMRYQWGTSRLTIACMQDALTTHKCMTAIAASLAVAHTVAIFAEHGEALSMADVMEQHLALLNKTTHVYKALSRVEALKQAGDDEAAANALGRGGNAVEVVGSAFYFAWKYQWDFTNAVRAAIRAGGDADTRGAVVGAICGAHLGLQGIPQQYRDGVLNSRRLTEIDDALFADRAKDLQPA